MKVVIIGGGIAGMALGIFLREKNIETVVSERLVDMPTRGHAFLMHSDGLAKLKKLNPDKKISLAGKSVNAFSLRRPSNKEIKNLQLDSWKCVKRSDLIQFLKASFPKELVKEGRDFSHFIYKDSKVIAAAFDNGEMEYGDVFVGADGGNSKVREFLFGKVNFTPVAVKEIVGVSCNKAIAEKYANSFIKFQDSTQGLAFGIIPTSDTEVVWFMQYDPALNDIANSTPEELALFCHHVLKDFPQAVIDVLSTNDFTTSYIWNTRDFDLLPAFHHQNVVLIGDAAHLSLPFTSAGTTNAIVDARIVADNLAESGDYETSFERYYQQRSEEVAKHIHLGRELKNIFLNPQDQHDDDIPVPLIAQKENDELIGKSKKIQIQYFTDPVCSTCWIIQPLLRKLTLEYSNYIHISYCMGGMLPSWDEYSKGSISNPMDAAQHWEDVCTIHGMPLDGDIWIEDPLHSSYPPSIAFKAAQMQDNNLALLFLRRIKEMVFVEKKNIIKWEFLEKAAFEVGLDSARLLRDFEGKAKDLFAEDLSKGRELGITSFPTLIFTDKEGQPVILKGYHPYERFEEIILSLVPSAKKKAIDTDSKNLFTHFPTMADKEFELLSNLNKQEATIVLDDLHQKGHVEKHESKNGVLWKRRFATSEW